MAEEQEQKQPTENAGPNAPETNPTQNPDWADMIEVKDTAEPGDMGTEDNKIPVSYTHLTLPTICSV